MSLSRERGIPGFYWGHLSMLFATVLWGAMAPIAKRLLAGGLVDGFSLSALRIGGGACLFILASFLPKRFTSDEKIDIKDLKYLFMASIIMIAANQGLFIIGIEYTTPIDTAVMCTLTPVFTLILAALFIHQRLTLLKVFGVFIGLVGALVIAFSDYEKAIAPNPLLGNTLCVVAQVCAAIYYVFFLKIINKYTPFTIMKWMFLFSALIYVPCMFPWLKEVEWGAFATPDILSLAYIIVFPTFVAYLIIPFAQRLLKPTVISMYAYIQPVIAAVISSLMGLAIFGFTRIFGTLLIFIGVFIVSILGQKQEKKCADENCVDTPSLSEEDDLLCGEGIESVKDS